MFFRPGVLSKSCPESWGIDQTQTLGDIMKMRVFLFAGWLAIVCGGCLTFHSQVVEIRFADDFETGEITVRFTDLRSDETTPEKQQEDFAILVKNLNSDEMLLDELENGIYVKQRRLFEENGVLNGEYAGVFRDLQLDDTELKTQNDERVLILEADDEIRIETNGRMVRTDGNIIIAWPKDQQEISWKYINLNYEKAHSLVNYYREWRHQD